jgi:hypothetical protein
MFSIVYAIHQAALMIVRSSKMQGFPIGEHENDKAQVSKVSRHNEIALGN